MSAVWLIAVLAFYCCLNPAPLGNFFPPLAGMFFIGLAAIGSGLKVLNKLNLRTDTFLENITFSGGFGLGILYIASLALGLAGLYRSVYASGVVFLLLLISFPELKDWINKSVYKLKQHSGNRFSLIGALFLIVLVSFLGIALLSAITPPVSEYALSGSLATSGSYVIQGGITAFPYSYQIHLPPGMSSLQALGLLIAGETGAGPVSFFFLFFLLTGVYSMTRKFFHRKIALFACAIMLSTPALINFYVSGHPFMGSVFFGFLAVYCYICWTSRSGEITGMSDKWIVACGIFAGLSISFGFYSIFVPMALVIMIIYSIAAIKKDISFQDAVNHAAWFLIPFIAVLLPHVIKNLITAGNPLFPFFSRAFIPLGIEGARESLWGYLMPLWNIPFAENIRWSNFFLMGPLYFLFIPAVIAVREIGKTVKLLLRFTVLYLIIYIVAGRDMAFIYFLMPVLSIITAYIIVNLYGQKKYFYHFVMAVFFIGLFINFNLIMGSTKSYGNIYFTLGLESREEHLKNNLPGYSVFRYINENTPAESVILIAGETRTFYIERPVVGGDVFIDNPILDMIRRHGTPEGFLEEIQEMNITHILIGEGFGRYWPERDRFIFDNIIKNNTILLLDKKGYRLYRFL